MSAPSPPGKEAATFGMLWWDGVCLYISFLVSLFVIAMPVGLFAILSTQIDGMLKTVLVIAYYLTVGPVVLSKVFRVLDSRPLPNRLPDPPPPPDDTETKAPDSEPSVEAQFAEAVRLDQGGEWVKAVAVFDALAERLAGQQDGVYASNCAREVREKLSRAQEK